MKASIKTLATVCITAVAGFSIVGVANHGDNQSSDSSAITTTVTFENISLTRTYSAIVDGAIVANIGPRQSSEYQIDVGLHAIAYRNAETGESASEERTVNISQNEHLTVYCSYGG